MSDPINGINGATPVTVVSTGEAAAAPATDTEAAAIPAAAPVDQADVGGTEALLTQIAEAANAAPSVDEAKVSALQQQIANGTYQVDPQRIAEKMMQVDTALGSGGGDR